MKPFDEEVAEILTHYYDVARAHGMDRALREAVESNVFTRRELAGVRRRVEQLEAQLEADALDKLVFLWREYVLADAATLTEDARELAEQVRQKVYGMTGTTELMDMLRRHFDECRIVECVRRDGNKAACYIEHCLRVQLRDTLRRLTGEGRAEG